MLMLMLNLIKLQHALGASIPNCVIYSKYTAEYICTKSPHVPCLVFTYFSSFTGVFFVFCCFFNIELAVKQVQFENVNTGSFLFFWLCRWIKRCGGKKYMKIKLFFSFFFKPPKLRSCETKPTWCVQNKERTSHFWSRGQGPLSVLAVLWVFGCALLFWRGSAPHVSSHDSLGLYRLGPGL